MKTPENGIFLRPFIYSALNLLMIFAYLVNKFNYKFTYLCSKMNVFVHFKINKQNLKFVY